MTVGALAALCITGCGSTATDDHVASTQAAIDPGLAKQLDPQQLERAQAQAVADRFASKFANYLANGTATDLRRSGATGQLVQRITRTPHRADSSTDRATALRPSGVVVRRDHDGWIATTTLQPAVNDRSSDPSLPLTFRIEHHATQAVVVDLNAGGQG